MVFNPFVPLYIYDKFMWLVIDIIAGVLFLINVRGVKS